MKRLAVGSSLLLLLTAISLSGFISRPAQQPNNTPMSFAGDLMDNECAAQHSHDAMIKKEGFKNSKDCTLGCVKSGGRFVLYASANKTTYQLDDQEKPTEFAGQKVTIIGTYDGETKTIHVQAFNPLPETPYDAGKREGSKSRNALGARAIWSPPIFSASEH